MPDFSETVDRLKRYLLRKDQDRRKEMMLTVEYPLSSGGIFIDACSGPDADAALEVDNSMISNSISQRE